MEKTNKNSSLKDSKGMLKKEYLLLSGLILISLVIIATFVFSKSYALEGFGKLYLSCDKLTASGGEDITCILTGEVSTSNQVSALETQVSLSDNLEFVSFTVQNDDTSNVDNMWQGTGENGNIQLYTANNKTSKFSVGELKLKVKNDVVNTKESINLLKTFFYDEDFKEQSIIDTTLEVKTPQFSSDKYAFEESYILVNDKKIEDILTNITTEGCTAVVDINESIQTKGNIINGAKLNITKDNKIIKVYDIVYVGSTKYDLNKDYIISSLKNIENIKTEIETVNSSITVKDNQLLLEYDGNVIKNYDILNLTTTKYIINPMNNVIITDGTAVDNILNDIMYTNNITLNIDDGKLNIIYKGNKIKELNILSVISDIYDISLDNNYIYIKNNKISESILDNITTSLDVIIDDNKLKLSYNHNTVANLNIININSDDYIINTTDSYIYTKNITNIDTIRQNISVNNANLEIKNNNLVIVNNDIVIDEFNLLNISTSNLINSDNYLLIEGELDYTVFINSIIFNNLSYKIFDTDNNELQTGKIKENYKLKVYINENLLDTYIIKCDYLKLDTSLQTTEENIIYNLDLNDTYADIISKIDTSGNISILDQDNNKKSTGDVLVTGDKIKIILSSQTIEYTISVLGDPVGNGKVTAGSVAKIYQHVKKVEGKEITKKHEFLAADVTGDGIISVADVAKLYQYLKNVISSLK